MLLIVAVAFAAISCCGNKGGEKKCCGKCCQDTTCCEQVVDSAACCEAPAEVEAPAAE